MFSNDFFGDDLPVGLKKAIEKRNKLSEIPMTLEEQLTGKRTKYKQRHALTLDGEDFYWGEEIY